MNINSVLNSTHPISVYKKENDKRDTSFMDILAQSVKESVSEQVTEYTATAEEIQAIEAKTADKYDPSYTLTDEEAEYFREKYGENYDEKNLKDFFFELAEKGIIHEYDAMTATRMSYIRKVNVVGYVPPGADMWELWEQGKVQLIAGKKIWSTTRAFERDYDIFKQSYNKDVITWEDYIQEQLDFVEYFKGCDVIHVKDGTISNTLDWSERQSRIERTAEVLKQLFGQQSAGGNINE